MSEWFANLQKVLPQHGISRLAGRLASSQRPWLKKMFIERFAAAYNVSLAEAEQKSFGDFDCFNSFFTRALEPGARPINSENNQFVSPADGKISQLGKIERDQLLQAKGHTYSLNSLAGELGRGFENGTFCTIYLAPSDYHRVHLPYSGTLSHSLAIPGALFSVNGSTESAIAGLFCRNERLVCRFETDFGPMLTILVGAMIVASIETDWVGPTSPYQTEELNEHGLYYETGDEIGRFLLGSTAICCFPENTVELDQSLDVGTTVRMGQVLGKVLGTVLN